MEWDERMGKRGKSLSAAVLTVTVLPFQGCEDTILWVFRGRFVRKKTRFVWLWAESVV